MNNDELLKPDKIIKTKRKSISLIIKNNGDFIVRAPIRVKDNYIQKFIQKKQEWIIKKRTEQLNNATKELAFHGDEEICILGEIYKIFYTTTSRVKIDNNIIHVPNLASKEKLIAFLKRFAKKYLTDHVEKISQTHNFNYASISVNSAKTCWGSCSFSNKLHFTYKLIMCPSDVVDYIIIHELCHTKIKNHSPLFWNLVQNYDPEYKKHEKWLKENRGLINLI